MRRFAMLPFFVAAALWPTAALAADFTVQNTGMTAYNINGTDNPSLSLTRGHTYTFTVNSPGHPFFIKTAQVTGTGSTFDTGVTNNGTTSGTLTFSVPFSAPATLFYQCSIHVPMTGTIAIATAPAQVPSTGALALVLVALTLGGAGFLAMRWRSAEA
jgi:plastocyanin